MKTKIKQNQDPLLSQLIHVLRSQGVVFGNGAEMRELREMIESPADTQTHSLPSKRQKLG